MGAINQAEAATRGQIIREARAAGQIGLPDDTTGELPSTTSYGTIFAAGDHPNKT